MARPAKQQITVTLDPRSVELMDLYAQQLHLSRSAFVDLMVTQIDQVLRVGTSEESDAGPSGDD